MSVKVNNANIFASLQDDSDNEAPVVKKAPAAKAVDTKPAASTPATTGQKLPRGAGRGERKPAADGEQPRQRKENNNRHRDRDAQKPKGVSSDPHPQDRQSGTGVPAYEKKFRKDGGGRGNYGTVKNEVDAINKEETVAQKTEVPVVEEPVVVDNTITVEEYFRQLGVTGDVVVQEAPKRELNHEELKREKLQVVVSRNEKTFDANVIKAQKKKNTSNPTYLLGCNTDNSELLGVKTGQVAVKFTEKPEGGDKVGAERPREPREPREPRTNTKPAHNNGPRNAKKVQVESEADFPKLA